MISLTLVANAAMSTGMCLKQQNTVYSQQQQNTVNNNNKIQSQKCLCESITYCKSKKAKDSDWMEILFPQIHDSIVRNMAYYTHGVNPLMCSLVVLYRNIPLRLRTHTHTHRIPALLCFTPISPIFASQVQTLITNEHTPIHSQLFLPIFARFTPSFSL